MPVVGALSGLSKAAAILIGKSLGTQEYDRAYRDAQRLMRCGLAASLVLSALLLVFGRLYTTIYRVEPEVRATAYLLLVVFAVISPVKVQNMILGGGILKSGGKTNYTLAIDLIGTWGFGVPLGFLAAFVLKLPVAPVYFLLSLEECVLPGALAAAVQKTQLDAAVVTEVQHGYITGKRATLYGNAAAWQGERRLLLSGAGERGACSGQTDPP